MLRAGGGTDGRALLLAILTLYFGAVWHWSHTQGWEPAWRHLRVPAMSTNFIDSRAVLSAYDRFRAGAPMDQVQSPPSKGARFYSMTYPRTWLVFSYLGLGEASTVPVALTLSAACFGFTFFYVGRLTWGQAAVYQPMLLSPSLMLAVERGNVDLLLYLMVLAACWLFARAALALACAVLLAAGALKIYPVAAMLPVLRHRRGRLAAGACAVLFAAFCFTQSADLAWVMANTPHDSMRSFGEFVATERWQLPRIAGMAASAVGIAGAMLAAWAQRARPWTLPEDMRGAGFLAGSGILAACYLIGNNYIYRFWFAVLLLPQLMRWILAGGREARWAVWMLSGLVLATWATAEPGLWLLGLTLNWLLFGGVVYGLASVLLPSFPIPVRLTHDR